MKIVQHLPLTEDESVCTLYHLLKLEFVIRYEVEKVVLISSKLRSLVCCLFFQEGRHHFFISLERSLRQELRILKVRPRNRVAMNENKVDLVVVGILFPSQPLKVDHLNHSLEVLGSLRDHDNEHVFFGGVPGARLRIRIQNSENVLFVVGLRVLQLSVEVLVFQNLLDSLVVLLVEGDHRG